MVDIRAYLYVSTFFRYNENKWEHIIQDASFRQAYEEREKILMDEAAGVAHALNKGREEGIQEGIKRGREQGVQQGKRQMILGMHRLQVPIETIAQASELTIEEVKKSYKRHNKRLSAAILSP